MQPVDPHCSAHERPVRIRSAEYTTLIENYPAHDRRTHTQGQNDARVKSLRIPEMSIGRELERQVESPRYVLISTDGYGTRPRPVFGWPRDGGLSIVLTSVKHTARTWQG